MNQLEIIASAEKIVEEIRDYSRSQKELWQRIPLLALEADGRTGFSDNYTRAYGSGFWALGGSVDSGGYTIYVDLASGELVDAHSASRSFSIVGFDCDKESVIKPAIDNNVMKLVFYLNQLDAQRIITLLEEEAETQYPSYYAPKEQEAWRTKTREELNLPELYVR